MLSLSQCLPVYSFYLSHALFVFKSVIFQLIYFSSSAFYRTFLCNYLSLSPSPSLSLPLSQVCKSYFHVAAHDSHWRRHLRCFELPQTVSLFSCLCMSLCICQIVSRSNWLSHVFLVPPCFFSVFVCYLWLSVLSACFFCLSLSLYLSLFFLSRGLFLPDTHTQSVSQSVNQSLIHSLMSVFWSPSGSLCCLFIFLSLFLSRAHTRTHTSLLTHLCTHSCAQSLHNLLTHSLVLSLVLCMLSVCLSFYFFCLYPSVSVKYSVSSLSLNV